MIRDNDYLRRIFLESIDEVDVSLDFANASYHNNFRGQLMAYSWATDTLSISRENGKRLTIVTLGSDITMYEENIRGIFDIARKYDALIRVNIYRPIGGINVNTRPYLLSKERLIDTLSYINEHYQILALDDALLSSVLLNRDNDDPSGINSIRILPNGDITPSTYLIQNQYVIGNLRDNIDLSEIEVMNNKKLSCIIYTEVPEECKGCSYAASCKGGVIDRRYLWHGSLQQKDPYCFIDQPELLQRVQHKIKISNVTFQSVHDGYLPTLFFKNR